ncbi:ABC transporter substrate-binding protein [Halobiforma nitratireducens]|uniref:ABC transporter periplasmic protein n=1 Tax=Halobiforma nitratireducens JCM 10879 TaxID=1227454 RepID=M0LX17_9EURY|nr:ABC transporter substrate-binding protein [Halobiforma nitratireducens]EMA36645.1 ABC transporter periplasmic protein [Halobiforma nitratireducens JCM 10879]
MEKGAPSTTRRRALAGAGSVVTASLAGCSERLWSRAENVGTDQIGLTIKTVPADDDLAAATIMSQFRENLRDAGIAVTHEPVPRPDLYRDVLLRGDYDVFVARHPGIDEYDALRGLLHSQFVGERGWQNPFHFSDLTADEYLEAQRDRSGDERHEAIEDLLEHLAEAVPYTTVAFPLEVAGCREGIDARRPLSGPLDYLDVLSREPADGARDGPLDVGVYGERLGDRLNPLVVDRNRVDGLLGLLYDPLVRSVATDDSDADEGSGNGLVTSAPPDGPGRTPPEREPVPWLAEDVTWEDDGPYLRADVTLRDGLRWHDGTELTATDVVFTYRFIQDTSGGEVDGGVPAPRYRSRQTVLETVDALDDRTVRFSFGETTRPAAARAFSVPVLPEHVWEPRTEIVADQRTEALTTDNEAPVGSGLFLFEEVTMDTIRLEPFEEHVFRGSEDRPDVLEGFSQYSGLRFRIAPNVGTMIDSLLEGEIDLTGDAIPPGEVESLVDGDGVSTVTGTANSFYIVGYNHHHPELGNPRFRRLISRLVDRQHAAVELFDGYAQPANSIGSHVGIPDGAFGPDYGVGSVAGGNDGDDGDSTSDDVPDVLEFPGTDGEIDVELVRSLFRDAGYRYEDGELLE